MMIVRILISSAGEGWWRPLILSHSVTNTSSASTSRWANASDAGPALSRHWSFHWVFSAALCHCGAFPHSPQQQQHSEKTPLGRRCLKAGPTSSDVGQALRQRLPCERDCSHGSWIQVESGLLPASLTKWRWSITLQTVVSGGGMCFVRTTLLVPSQWQTMEDLRKPWVQAS